MYAPLLEVPVEVELSALFAIALAEELKHAVVVAGYYNSFNSVVLW